MMHISIRFTLPPELLTAIVLGLAALSMLG
jgi:hypothetical protein